MQGVPAKHQPEGMGKLDSKGHTLVKNLVPSAQLLFSPQRVEFLMSKYLREQ